MSVGWRFAMAFRVCWWSLVPNNTLDSANKLVDEDAPKGLSLLPTARSSLSHLKKLPTALLWMLIFKSRAISKICTNSRLTSLSSGIWSCTLRDEYKASVFVMSLVWLHSKLASTSRILEDAFPFSMVAQASWSTLVLLSKSACSVRTLSSSFLSLEGTSNEMELVE